MIKRYIPLIVLLAVIGTIIIIPLKVIAYGYLPVDDALRHSAKVVSGKDWDQIVVLRPGAGIDSHPGWHAILGLIHRITHCGADGLVVFSVAFLFLLFCLLPILFLRRPEAWLCALLAALLTEPSFVLRLFFGRPYIFAMSFVLVFCFIWRDLKKRDTPFGAMAVFTVLAALTTWIHGNWYLLAIPAISLFLAREFRSGVLFTISIAIGILLGSIMTGHPYIFLKQNLMHVVLSLNSHTLTRTLVTEFQPYTGSVLMIGALVFMLIWRRLRGSWNIKVIDNPVFITVVIGWICGFTVIRFWLDWGAPALLVWMSYEFQDSLKKYINFSSLGRLFLAGVLATTFYLAITADVGGRWTYNLTTEYLSSENKEHVLWLPGPGGIIYSDDMRVFYDTFYKNPHAPWRYILGFEPSLMPAEDLAIYRAIQWNYSAYKSFEPWVKKMRPQDRMILRRSPSEEPKIKGLEWYYAATNTWIGRLPDHNK